MWLLMFRIQMFFFPMFSLRSLMPCEGFPEENRGTI